MLWRARSPYGREDEALASVRRNIYSWTQLLEGPGLDGIIVPTSGCGMTITDYELMFRLESHYAHRARRISELAMDITEFLAEMQLPALDKRSVAVTYHSACSVQRGQKIRSFQEGFCLRRRRGLL